MDANNSLLAFAAIPRHGRHAPLADGIDAIADQLPQENFVA